MAYKKILIRRDPASSWTSTNPVLSAGEIGLETDTGKIKIGNGSSAWTALSYFVGNLPGATLDAIGDVTITSVQNGDFLRYNGSASVWVNDPVNLSTDTVGSYVESLVAGTGVSLLNNSGEGATPTVSIGQAVGTSSSVTFANVTADLVGNVTGNITGNSGTATTLQTARTIQISGDVSGSASFDGSQNINITSTVQPNSVALGTDTTGNYMSDLTQGNGVTITHTPGEGSNATIAIGQDVATSASVTFAKVTSNLTGNVTGNADTATALQTARTISLTGDVSGSVSFDGTSNAQITTAIQPNSIVLGTDTTGNYMESITNGTGIFLEHTLGEASQATISIGQAVGTGDTVTFAGVTADAIRIGVTNANTIDTVSDGLTISTTGGTVTIDDNLTVTGALTVSGSVTYVNTTNLQVGDAVITLNHDETGSPSQNAGIEVERGTSTNVVLHYNETSDVWEITNDGSSYSPIETTSTVTTKLNQQSALLDVWAVTNVALPNSPTYTAGTSDLNSGTGIGAKLAATTNGLLYVDNIPAGINYRVLVKDQANALHNGIYKVTAVGSASATWELTRSSDFNNSTFGQTIVGKTVRAAADGDVNEFQVFAVTSLGSQYLGDIPEMVHVIGTDPIVWSQVSGKAVLIPGNGLEITNNTLTLPSITQSNTASTSGASNFVQNVSVDSYGRLIGITTNDALLALGTNTTGDYVASISASVGSGITVSGTGEGAVVEVSSNATPNNTASTIVMRDSSGYFSATGITAELTGNASTANTLYVSRSIGLTGDLSGSVSFNGSQDVNINATIQPNSVALGTDTSGDYVSSLVAGTGVTLTNNSGETATPTIAIGQAVETSSSVTFANVTADLVGNVTGNVIGSVNGNAGTATALQTSRAISLTGDVSGSVSFNGTSDVSITATVQPNSVALGTDTTGNYMSDLTQGTGVTITHTPGEGSNATIGIGQAVGTSSSVTFAAVSAPVVGDVTGNASTATTLQTSRTIELTGDVTGSASFNGSANASISATIAPNSVALGTDTSGDYVSTITAGTGVTVTGGTGETSTPTVAIGQAVATSSSVTFARVETTGNLVVGGNLQVVGTTTTVNETNLSIEDTFIYLNDGSTTTNPDLGWAGNYNDGTYAHAGLFRDATDGKFKFFDSYTLEPTDPINVGHASYSAAPVVAERFESTIATGTAPLSVSSSTVVTNLNADLLDGQSGAYYAPVNNASFTGTFSAPSGTITSTMIADGTIVDADVNASAAIALSKLATGTAGTVVLHNASGVPTATAISGDIAITDAGVASIGSGVIVNADVNASAAIDLGKLADVSTNAQTASYTLVLADKNKIVEMNVGSANNLTVPLNSSQAFPIGSQINILQTGTGQTTIVATGGVTINATPGLKMRAQWSYATLVKRATDTWVLVGDISA